MKDKPANFELLEPASPEALVPDSWVEPWMALTAVGLLLIIAAWFAFRKKKPAAIDPQIIRNAAYHEALAGLEKITALQARDAAVQCSLILRRYLSVAANDPALFETHEEFISRHDALNALTEAARKTSESGFSRLASIKYAAEVPDVSPLEVATESRSLLETLHHGFHA
jgi:hypothetical protein